MNKYSDYSEEENREETLATPGVIDKYQAAGKIANFVLEKVIEKCQAEANIVDICRFGDNLIESEVAKVYAKKKLEKGIAFPVCISVNEVCGHFSPLASEPKNLAAGDVAKIDLGVHVDGFIALVAHTVVIGESSVEGRKADAILAAYNALQAGLRLLKPGSKNDEITQNTATISEAYKCNPLEGVLSHDVKKHLIDGNECIINKATFDQKVEEHEFQVNEVFVFDVIVSTGEGKPKESELRTTVYKRALERTYNLKSKSSRAFYNEVINKYPSLCFSMRAFEDEITAKLGVKECNENQLLNNYPILLEKSGDIVAQFKVTAMILQGKTVAITGLPVDVANFKTENSIQDEAINTLLSQSMNKNAQKSQKKKTKAGDNKE